MARKYHRRRGGFRVGKYVNLGFKVLGAVVASNTIIRGVTKSGIPPDIRQVPVDVSYEVTGFDPNHPGAWDASRAFGTVLSVLGGIAVWKIGGMIARRV